MGPGPGLLSVSREGVWAIGPHALPAPTLWAPFRGLRPKSCSSFLEEAHPSWEGRGKQHAPSGASATGGIAAQTSTPHTRGLDGGAPGLLVRGRALWLGGECPGCLSWTCGPSSCRFLHRSKRLQGKEKDKACQQLQAPRIARGKHASLLPLATCRSPRSKAGLQDDKERHNNALGPWKSPWHRTAPRPLYARETEDTRPKDMGEGQLLGRKGRSLSGCSP